MGQNTRQLLWLILIAFSFTALIVWWAPLELNSVVWSIRFLSPLGALGMGFVCYRVWTRPDQYADNLRDISRRYFDRAGLCFAPRIEVENGIAHLCVYFQNRYEREAIATIAAQPGIGSFRVSRGPLPYLTTSVQCPGVGFGVARFSIAIPQKLQGRKQRFELAADVIYPQWRGKMLRFRSGKRAGSVRKLSQGSQALNVIIGALLFGVGCIFITECPASVTLVLPEDVADRLPQGSSPRVEILWEPAGGTQAITPPRVAA